jgi:hypothetical protein
MILRLLTWADGVVHLLHAADTRVGAYVCDKYEDHITMTLSRYH